MISADVIIIGAGIAGASLAARLVERGVGGVLLLEAEDQPGYHATGRSAAFWSETYGGPVIQPLTTASLDFLSDPPEGFVDYPLMRPRGLIHVADADSLARLEAFGATFAGSSLVLDPLDRAAMLHRAPMLSERWVAGLWEPSCADIDVGALHQAYLRMARRGGAKMATNAALRGAARDGGRWRLDTAAGAMEARVLVNAAGAWADDVARIAGARPIGITPYRRTMLQLIVDPAPSPDLPVVVDASGALYFKPEAGRLWVSPHDETAQAATDAAPEELDIAITIDRLEKATTWRQPRLERSWAGLRSFAPDRAPVYGFDPDCDGFFWCAGQGGFGIQTSPAASALAAALLLGMPDDSGIDPTPYSPARF